MTARDVVGAPESGSLDLVMDGVVVPAYDGDTIAAALVRAGRMTWRTTRVAGAARGLFCGIGACHDCLVTVDGAPNVRACLHPVEPGAVVTSQQGTGVDA